jgi:hypothetical protein
MSGKDDVWDFVLERLGQPTPTDLAALLRGGGVAGEHNVRRATRWLKGENGPNFEGALHTLDLAGLLQPEAVGLLHGLDEEKARKRVAEMRKTVTERAEADALAQQVAEAADSSRESAEGPGPRRRARGEDE